jgi:hypothetical protein
MCGSARSRDWDDVVTLMKEPRERELRRRDAHGLGRVAKRRKRFWLTLRFSPRKRGLLLVIMFLVRSFSDASKGLNRDGVIARSARGCRWCDRPRREHPRLCQARTPSERWRSARGKSVSKPHRAAPAPDKRTRAPARRRRSRQDSKRGKAGVSLHPEQAVAMECDEGGPPRWDARRVTEERARGGPSSCCTLDWI